MSAPPAPRTDVRLPSGPVQQHELEGLRRSLAMSDSLPRDRVLELIDECSHLLVERVRIDRMLTELAPAWGGARRPLNELHCVIRPLADRAVPSSGECLRATASRANHLELGLGSLEDAFRGRPGSLTAQRCLPGRPSGGNHLPSHDVSGLSDAIWLRERIEAGGSAAEIGDATGHTACHVRRAGQPDAGA
jgi:hypothetical protein